MNLREITFRHDTEDHLVVLSMPDEYEVVIEHKRSGCEPHHRVDGKFLVCGNAYRYYLTKREQLLTAGWTILSVTMRVYNVTDETLRCGMFVKLQAGYTEENEIEVVKNGSDFQNVCGVLVSDIDAKSYGVCQTYGKASVNSNDMKSVIKEKIDKWVKLGIIDSSKMEAIDVKEIGKPIVLTLDDIEIELGTDLSRDEKEKDNA